MAELIQLKQHEGILSLPQLAQQSSPESDLAKQNTIIQETLK